MKCENLQFNLSISGDDVLSREGRRALGEHLVQCPLCRQKAAEFQTLRGSLRGLPRPEPPRYLLASVRNRVAAEAAIAERKQPIFLNENLREWLLMRLMPYSVGTVAAVLLTFGLLWTLLPAASSRIGQADELAGLQPPTRTAVLLTDGNPQSKALDYAAGATDFSVPQMTISSESPAINPQGALIALTKSFVRGKMRDDEVVVVAEVFGNGLARIDEVVEPSRNRQAIRELEKALKSDPNYAPPFVPAHFDQGSDSVRVVLKIQSVNIDTHLRRK